MYDNRNIFFRNRKLSSFQHTQVTFEKKNTKGYVDCLKQQLSTAAVCPKSVETSRPERVSQSLTVWSAEAEATRRSSSENTT